MWVAYFNAALVLVYPGMKGATGHNTVQCLVFKRDTAIITSCKT